MRTLRKGFKGNMTGIESNVQRMKKHETTEALRYLVP